MEFGIQAGVCAHRDIDTHKDRQKQRHITYTILLLIPHSNWDFHNCMHHYYGEDGGTAFEENCHADLKQINPNFHCLSLSRIAAAWGSNNRGWYFRLSLCFLHHSLRWQQSDSMDCYSLTFCLQESNSQQLFVYSGILICAFHLRNHSTFKLKDETHVMC